MRDRLFDATHCERCHADLSNTARTMSWFTEETICSTCSDVESMIRKQLPNYGCDHEGCGYVPHTENNLGKPSN